MKEIRSDWGKMKSRVKKIGKLVEEIENHPEFLEEENISPIKEITDDILKSLLTIESALRELKERVEKQ